MVVGQDLCSHQSVVYLLYLYTLLVAQRSEHHVLFFLHLSYLYRILILSFLYRFRDLSFLYRVRDLSFLCCILDLSFLFLVLLFLVDHLWLVHRSQVCDRNHLEGVVLFVLEVYRL